MQPALIAGEFMEAAQQVLEGPRPLVDEKGKFEILELPPYAPERRESAGLTEKFWFDQNRRLYKQARPGTGEHWAEKITSVLAAQLGLPTPDVELAMYNGSYGIASRSFLLPGETFVTEKDLLEENARGRRLSHGCSLSCHTLPTIFETLESIHQPIRWLPPKDATSTADTFLAYLLFDAWISNEDRHFENWGVIDVETDEDSPRRFHLAPTFDHASSLGREMDDEKRHRLMKRGRLTHYTRACRSGIYLPGARDPLSVHRAAEAAASICPKAAELWLDRILSYKKAMLEALFERIPAHAISQAAAELALAILCKNAQRLEQTYRAARAA